jgi:hypothetical protein
MIIQFDLSGVEHAPCQVRSGRYMVVTGDWSRSSPHSQLFHLYGMFAPETHHYTFESFALGTEHFEPYAR